MCSVLFPGFLGVLFDNLFSGFLSLGRRFFDFPFIFSFFGFFFLRRICFRFFISLHGRHTGRGMMVGGIEAGAFEDNADRQVDLLQRTFPTLRTTDEGLVGERLLFFELHTAVGTMVSIDWHSLFQFPLLLAAHYSPLKGQVQEDEE